MPPTQRPPRTPPPRPNLSRPLLLGTVVAVAFAIGTVGTPFRSLGWMIALTTLATTIVATSTRRPATLIIGLSGAALLPWLAIRMSPWLIAVNLATALGLLLLSISLPVAGSLQVPGHHHLSRVLRSCSRLPHGPAHLTHAARSSTHLDGTGRRLTRLVPSLLAGVASLAIALLLLASGDALLASFLDVGDAPTVVVPRLFAAAAGLLLFALLLGGIAPPGSHDGTRDVPVPSATPTLFTIGGLATAIGLYAAVQVSAAVLGADFVRNRTGVTYAEWARGGFFQLVVVSAIATAAVLVARGVIRKEPSQAFRLRSATAALTVGVVVTVAASVIKLAVYAETFGLTMLRIYTVVFACWLGLVAVLAFLSLLQPARNWLAPTVITSIAVGAFAMNVANPERIVVEHNVDRAATTGTLDVEYLNTLSLDAAPTLLSRLDDIDAITAKAARDEVLRSEEDVAVDARTEIRRAWCARVGRDGEHDGLSFNAARNASMRASRSACR